MTIWNNATTPGGDLVIGQNTWAISYKSFDRVVEKATVHPVGDSITKWAWANVEDSLQFTAAEVIEPPKPKTRVEKHIEAF